MNEKLEQKVELYRNFKKTLLAVASELDAKATHKPHDDGWRVIALDNEKVEVRVVYTHYTGSNEPAVYVGPGPRQRKLTNLSASNLKKHLTKHLDAKRTEVTQYLDDAREADAREAASNKTEEQMADFIRTILVPLGYSSAIKDVDTPAWERQHAWFKLADVEVTGTVDNFSFNYNIEYDLWSPKLHLRGEFDAMTADRIASTLVALNALISQEIWPK